MKKILVMLVFCCAALGAQAQTDAITKFFSKYEEDTKFTVVNLTSRMFNLFTDLEVDNPEDKEILDAISKLKSLKILARDDYDNSRTLYKEINSVLPRAEYAELMTIRDDDSNMRFVVKEADGKISELVMVMGGETEFFLLSLVGDIDLSQIANISSKMNVEGLDHLKNLNDRKKSN